MLSRSGGLPGDQLGIERVRDPAGNLVLQSKEVGRIGIEPFGPDMRIKLGSDQLGGDPNPTARPSEAACEYIAHTQLAADLLRVDPLVSVSKCGITRDHKHACDPATDRSSDPR